MSKRREFNDILDECLERLLAGGETVEQCLRSFPEHADQLQPLLETTLVARQALAIEPRPEFRELARNELYAALREAERQRSRPFFGWSWQPRWAVAVAVVVVLVLAGGGTVAAAGGSMPDEALYGVKLATEDVRLALTPSALGKAELYARLVDKRVLEIVRMADKGKPAHVERAARRLEAYLTRIAALSGGQEVTAAVTLAPAAEAELAPKAVPAPRAEAVAEETAEEAAVEEAAVVEEAVVVKEAVAVEEAASPRERAGRGRDDGAKDERRARLKAMIASNASKHQARLYALLDTVPESARPALLRAIAMSETGYQKALEALD